MARDSKFLAFDFGAESGRALLGELKDNILTLKEIHRFPNTPVRVLGDLHWDILRLFHDIKQGLKVAFQETDGEIDGIGVDTWGVDFGLLDENGNLLGNPWHYRDERTNGIMEETFKAVSKEDIFTETGIQFMQLNTIFQLVSMVKNNSVELNNAKTLLFIPDLFNYWLTGKKVSEFSIASTSQCYNPKTGNWAYEMLEKLNIPTSIFPTIVKPGTVIGNLHDSLTSELGIKNAIPVIAPATHDTGSAVAALPSNDDNCPYLSSGTWSLMGVEIKEPIINNDSMKANFTNEGGVEDTFRFLHNIMGLWLVQECRRTWIAEGDEISYSEITSLASHSEGFKSIIKPNDPIFLTPGNMPERIKNYCKQTNQYVPETKGEIVRCALDSLALAYRETIETLESLLGKKLDCINILGGGTQNKLLCQLTADASNKKVIAGPIEATAIGNVLVQAIATGSVSSLSEAREIVKNSFSLETYLPNGSSEIEKAYSLYNSL